jgi:3-hydroxyisobutyrate dehydrogenase-like beta-hydroxyacid dehydrogenase
MSASQGGGMDIGIVGLGRMGGNMARRLARGCSR